VFTAFHAHASEKREIIGEALSKPIFRDQIDTKGYLYGQLHRLFRAPFEKVFFEKHKEELEPEKWELDSAKSYFLKKHEQKMQEKKQDILAKVKLYEHQLKKPNLSDSKRKELESDKEYALMELEPPDDSFYEYILSHWKFHKYLYNNYGGGRVIWEQEGMVAFDAMLNWLKHHEKIGDFKIYDEQLHRKFYSYWTEMDTNSSFFLGDKEMKDFIHPEWEPINDK
jgi:hypothetical protein